MSYALEIEKFDEGITGYIEYDPEPLNPLDDSDIKVAYRSSSRYVLGNDPVSAERMDEIRDQIASGELIGVPVYAYIHGGATVKTTPFSCSWDSGQSGFAYITKEMAEKEWPTKEDALKYIEACLESFDRYLTGQVYMYKIEDSNGEIIDSCHGYEDKEDALNEMRAMAEHCVQEAVKERLAAELKELAAPLVAAKELLEYQTINATLQDIADDAKDMGDGEFYTQIKKSLALIGDTATHGEEADTEAIRIATQEAHSLLMLTSTEETIENLLADAHHDGDDQEVQRLMTLCARAGVPQKHPADVLYARARFGNRA